MPDQEQARVIPIEDVRSRGLALACRDIPGVPKVINFRRALDKLLKKGREAEWDHYTKQPEADMRDEGLVPIGELYRRKGYDSLALAVLGNTEFIARVDNIKKVKKLIKEVEAEEIKLGVRLIHKSETVEDPMIYKRDRGFWMRRTAFELFEL